MKKLSILFLIVICSFLFSCTHKGNLSNQDTDYSKISIQSFLSAELITEYKKVLTELLAEPEDIDILKEIGKLYFFIGMENQRLENSIKG